jgi:osmotically inducible protein OsmC
MPMAERRAESIWEGNLTEGKGRLSVGTGVLSDQPVTWAARTEDPAGMTSPEELLAAAHAACYSMALSATLARNNTPPTRLHVTATCALDPKEGGGVRVSTMDLHVRGVVPGLDQSGFEELARQGEQGCPISNAIRNNVDIRLKAELESA